MGEMDNRTESDGKGLFIICNGQKVAKYEAGKWGPLIVSSYLVGSRHSAVLHHQIEQVSAPDADILVQNRSPKEGIDTAAGNLMAGGKGTDENGGAYLKEVKD